MIISMIAAMDEKRGIGYKGKIPWHIKKDLLRFKNLTLGKTIIIGRKTHESLIGYYKKSGRSLPKRKTIVVTRNKKYSVSEQKNTFIVSSVEGALELAEKIEPDEVFISGGGEIFKQGIRYADKLYLTIVKGEYKADSFFPQYPQFARVAHLKEAEENGTKFVFVELEK